MKPVSPHKEYARIKEGIVPGLVFNQTLYEQILYKCVTERTVWLDAGCGHKILPAWRESSEDCLIKTARFVCGCDVDAIAIKEHRSLNRLVVCDLAAMPFKDSTFTLITCNMVAEHLDKPEAVFAEFARLLVPGQGTVIVHTPFRWSYFAIISGLIPQRLKNRVGPLLDGRPAVDYYPVRYRCNTPGSLRRTFTSLGLEQLELRMLASEAVLQWLAGSILGTFLLKLELRLIKLSLRSRCRYLRVTLCGIFRKPALPA
jgi:SAM-dependent methyltransferase